MVGGSRRIAADRGGSRLRVALSWPYTRAARATGAKTDVKIVVESRCASVPRIE